MFFIKNRSSSSKNTRPDNMFNNIDYMALNDKQVEVNHPVMNHQTILPQHSFVPPQEKSTVVHERVLRLNANQEQEQSCNNEKKKCANKAKIRQRFTDVQVSFVKLLYYEEGLSMREITLITGMNKSSICRYMKKYKELYPQRTRNMKVNEKKLEWYKTMLTSLGERNLIAMLKNLEINKA